MAPVKTNELLTFSYAMTLCCAIIEIFQLLVHNQPFAYSEAVIQRCSVKRMFLEIPQNSKEGTCTKISFLTVSLGYFSA